MRLKNYLLLLLIFSSPLITYGQVSFNPEAVVGSDSKLSRTGNLDGDGKPDLVSGSYSNVSVFLNISTDAQITSGTFANPLQLSNKFPCWQRSLV
ncbi:MAG TPA: VCBS repeat-containing protein [Cytophagaceae bacterium]